jgi:histidyl-tRNA synthetase
MAKISPISGFPEWSPEDRLIEEEIINKLKALARSYGFMPIETASVEHYSTLASKGVVDKELYVLRRAQASDDAKDEGALAMHFDLTVPFARYVSQNSHKLSFPFRRYQVQKVWRGDRPQRGRFREFYQFDFDVVVRDALPVCLDAEVVGLVDAGLSIFDIGPHEIRINNRKILHGLYESLGVEESKRADVIRVIDKIHKIGAQKVKTELTQTLSIAEGIADSIVQFSSKMIPATTLAELKSVATTARFQEGLDELIQIVSLVPSACRERLVYDGSLARGLDYYTGLIFEAIFKDYPEFGSCGGGGRYESLTAQFGGDAFPGVGGSLGFTRLMSLLWEVKKDLPRKKSPAQVLIISIDDASREKYNVVAHSLRSMGVCVEVYYKSAKMGKQIESADSRGIPYVLFVEGDGTMSLKDLKAKEQTPVSSLEEIATKVTR